MKNLTVNYLLILLMAGFLQLVSPTVNAQDMAQAKALCTNLTPSNRAMAERAGYNVDDLCSVQKTQSKGLKAVKPRTIVNRNTASSAAIAVRNTEASAPRLQSSKLTPFGYDLFANAPTTFAPSESLSVSADYLLGPGDSLDILFYGKLNRNFSVEINREGFVDFPELGPVALAGLSYGEAKSMLRKRISAQVVGTQVSITMGTLRSMQVFVLGEAFKPGAYTVSSLATITHALIASGGINDIGSLRNIQLKRKGVVIASLDIYDLLLFGDTSDDIQIRDFDVIYIPTVGDRVSIMGGVLRPAIYEMIGGETASDLVDLAGGLVAKAYAKSARLERVNEDGFLRVLDLDLTKPSDKQLHLRSGDHLAIESVTDFKKNIVTLAGAVRYPGIVAWRADLRISDLLKARDVLNSQADISVALLIRELPNSPDIKVFQFSPEQIFADLYSSDNRFLQSRDRIEILSLYGDRIEQIEPYIKMLKRQASFENVARVVTAGGEVRFPGSYPLVENMVMADLVKLSGGLKSSAYAISAEIGRIDLSDPTNAQRSIVISRFDQESSFKLQPSDNIEIRTLPDFGERQSITLQGEFVFPGTYDFEKGETLTSVIARAGGFTSEAFVGGSVFTRESLKKREQAELSRLSDLLQGQVESERLKQANSGVEMTNLDVENQEMAISRLSNVQAVGRLVIPLADLMAGVATDLILQNSDQLVIPKISQEVTVIGEVYRPSSHLFNEVSSQYDYIRKSGGLKHSADEDNIFIVKANGEVIGSENRLFKFGSVDADIQFGDSIVVPLDTEASDVNGVEFLTQISQIIYQLSLGAAAVNTFNKN